MAAIHYNTNKRPSTGKLATFNGTSQAKVSVASHLLAKHSEPAPTVAMPVVCVSASPGLTSANPTATSSATSSIGASAFGGRARRSSSTTPPSPVRSNVFRPTVEITDADWLQQESYTLTEQETQGFDAPAHATILTETFKPFYLPQGVEFIQSDRAGYSIVLDRVFAQDEDTQAQALAFEQQYQANWLHNVQTELDNVFSKKLGWSDPVLTLLLPPSKVLSRPPMRKGEDLGLDESVVIDSLHNMHEHLEAVNIYRLRFTGIAVGYRMPQGGFRGRPEPIWRIRVNPYQTLGEGMQAMDGRHYKSTRLVHLYFADNNNRMVAVSIFGTGAQQKNVRAGQHYVMRATARCYDKLVLQTSRVYHNGNSDLFLQPYYPSFPRVTNHDGISAAVCHYLDYLIPSPKQNYAQWNKSLHDQLRLLSTHVCGECGYSEPELMEITQRELGLVATHYNPNQEFTLDAQRMVRAKDVPDTIARIVWQLHRPQNRDQYNVAVRMAGKINAISVQSKALKHHKRAATTRSALAVRPSDLDMLFTHIEQTTGFSLTDSQKGVSQEVVRALASPTPLSGLLSGDVGTGKTMPIMLTAIAAHRAGAKVAIITPRELLAIQLYEQLSTRFAGLAEVERVESGRKIINPNAILIGTPGLATVAHKQKWQPDYLIIDEQHKFATKDRERMVAEHTHLLELSATPIPRSLAASIYGGMKLFNLRECPVEKTIHSTVLDMQGGNKSLIVARIREAVASGGRVAIVYPRVVHQSTTNPKLQADSAEEEGDLQHEDDVGRSGKEHIPANISQKQLELLRDEQARASVELAYQSFSKLFPGKCCMLHGKMDAHALNASIAGLRSGQTPIVIASTIIEIGIDIPSVQVMVVREPEYFGISQLHQLRGRLVRNGGEGYFIMAPECWEELDAPTQKRLNTIAECSDGYELAERDLAERGFGDIDGVAQTGDSNMVFRGRLRMRDCLQNEASEILRLAETAQRDELPLSLGALRSTW